MPNQDYSDEFKQTAIDQVIAHGHSINQVAARLGIADHTLHQWIHDAKSTSSSTPVQNEEIFKQRLRELQKENARLQMEVDILKKASAYSAKLKK